MEIYYCLPIVKKTKKEILAMIYRNLVENYFYFEVWIDYIEDLDEDFLLALADMLPQRLIVVFRRKEHEQMKMSLQQRLTYINLVSGKNIFIDLDINMQKKDLEIIKKDQGHLM